MDDELSRVVQLIEPQLAFNLKCRSVPGCQERCTPFRLLRVVITEVSHFVGALLRLQDRSSFSHLLSITRDQRYASLVSQSLTTFSDADRPFSIKGWCGGVTRIRNYRENAPRRVTTYPTPQFKEHTKGMECITIIQDKSSEKYHSWQKVLFLYM